MYATHFEGIRCARRVQTWPESRGQKALQLFEHCKQLCDFELYFPWWIMAWDMAEPPPKVSLYKDFSDFSLFQGNPACYFMILLFTQNLSTLLCFSKDLKKVLPG